MGKTYDVRIGPWERTKTKGHKIVSTNWEHTENEDEWTLHHRYAGPGHDVCGGTRIRISEKIAGDPEPSQFKARRWPYVNVEISLPIAVGDDADLAERLAKHLQHIIWAFVKAEGLVR